MTDIAILPLALTVMLGPQILVGMILITRKDPIISSLVYNLALIPTLILTTYFYYLLVNITGLQKASIGDRPIVKYFLIALCILLIIRSIVNRNKITEPPKWMQGISTASLGKIYIIGFCLIAFTPAVVTVAFTVGNLLNSESSSFLDALPFFGAVLLISILPLTIYFSLGSNGSKYLEKANTWLNTHGYLINVIVLFFFILLLI